ncbi:phospho-N-acetylmuramoyl-pentapeptide-transferase homolog isoform X3 [Rhododendron vialii]|uniref:phospho-N-acetylmuramoyl-pentapeptide- transferase homolog isoform X3 n=1 Tax=Rhododendron vialii TaxID=182163 RepID=UPI00265E4788|nr:phospho-N-acetylmuramoyl-pentapeptide-transferase homolog isoform X3 [Rhododendron vialii]
MSLVANTNCFARLGSQRYPISLLRISSNPAFRRLRPRSYFGLEGFSSLDDWEDDDDILEYRHSSSEVEESDGDDLLNPVSDIDLPTVREPFLETNDALTGTAHRLAMITRGRRKSRVKHGVITNIGLMTFLTILLLLVDCCAWRIVRLPLEPFYLMRPFCISAIVVSCAGYVCVPLLRSLKIHSIIRREGPARHSSKKGTPTMGGLFFVPIGIIVAEVSVGFSSIEVRGAAVATLAFAAIGLLDDVLSIIKNHNYGLSALMKILLEVAVGSIFSVWLETTKISSPYSMKMLVPLPSPLGLVCLGKCYLLLTSFCFVSMTNGINLTDGLDGLAGGTAALAFIGMSIAVLPICSDLSVFGASMAGACIGFLSHNRYKASVFMGDVGSLALGGALAAMASCTGMFLPLFISSGIFVLEAVSVIMQVSFFKTTKRLQGRGRRLFRMAPFHHHLELCGIKEPTIVAAAYVISSLSALLAGYVGLISA